MPHSFVIHGVPGSPFVRSVQLVLEEKAAPYRFESLPPGASKRPEYLARHPFGRVPAFEDGDFQLYETQAILRYVDAVVPQPALVPSDPRLAARMNQIMGINDWYLFPKVNAVIGFERIIGPKLLGHATNEEACAAAVPMARICFQALERLLAEQHFLAGEQLSLADLIIAPQLDFLAMTPEGRTLLEGTRLAQWLARMRARASMQRTEPPAMLRPAA
jgi:glutathione S-transferase